MKKIFKGKKEVVLKEIVEHFKNVPIKDENKIYQIIIDNTRTLSQNNLLHAMIRELGKEMGMEDIELLKKQLKFQFGYLLNHI